MCNKAGDSPSWFLPKTRIEPNANFVFIFEDLDRSLGGNRETITLADLGLDIQSKSSPLANLVSKGIPSLGPGCFGDWLVERGNEIVANIHIVDTSMPDDVQRECVKYGASSSFGVYYTVNTLTFTGVSGRDTPAVFLDESELVFLLRAASFCRDELGDSSIECPKKVLSHVYEFHSKLLTK
ncbi:hypothetical protein [Phaeobacter sp. CAU 1743]|uniref:hypothetical protein n=1 Tax=Phaeobacter sp. CAU 1743 TaxID=3140367 RepID=UPI00325C2930